MREQTNNNTTQAFWIGIGSLFSFGFSLVSSMILSRYFVKEDYGTYKQVLYVYQTLLVVFTLGLPKAYSFFLPRTMISQSKDLVRKITNLFILLGFFFTIILFVLSNKISLVLNNPDLSLAIKIFSPVPLLLLPTMGLEGILATYRMTKFMAVYSAITRLIMLCCVTFPVIFYGGNYIHAIIGFVISSFIAFILAFYFKKMPFKGLKEEKCTIKYREILNFSMPLMYASIWGIIINSADQFFISRYFGSEIFAEFSNGALELPFVGMIVAATATVLAPVFSKMSHDKLDPQKDIFPIWNNVMEKSIKIIYPLVIYTWFFSDIIIIIFFGEQYENSAIFFRIRVIVNFFTVIAYAPLIINIGKVKQYSNIHLFGAVFLIILDYLSILLIKSQYLLIGITVFCQVGMIYFMLRICARYFDTKVYRMYPYKLVIKIIVPSIMFLYFIHSLLVNALTMNHITVLILSFIIYISIYLLYSKFMKIEYKYIITPLLSVMNKFDLRPKL